MRDWLFAVRRVLVAACACLLISRAAHATIDLTGTWRVSQFPPAALGDFAQNGTQLTISFRGTFAPLLGNVNPDSGAFHFDLGASNVDCGHDLLDGNATPDGESFSALMVVHDGICHPLYIFLTGDRCTDSTGTNCPGSPRPATPQCGNGIVEAREQCDDGNLVSGDSCPADCRYSNALIRGDRNAPAHDHTGCQVEWYVVNPTNSPNRFAQPSMDQRCQDQDPTCDFDPLPGRCRFEVVACLNNRDPNLPACDAGGIASVRVLRPLAARFPIVQQLARNAAALVEAALVQLRDPGNPELGYIYGPPLSPIQRNFCSPPIPLEVLAGPRLGDSRVSALKLRTLSANPHGVRQLSRLRLTCTARPLP